MNIVFDIPAVFIDCFFIGLVAPFLEVVMQLKQLKLD